MAGLAPTLNLVRHIIDYIIDFGLFQKVTRARWHGIAKFLASACVTLSVFPSISFALVVRHAGSGSPTSNNQRQGLLVEWAIAKRRCDAAITPSPFAVPFMTTHTVSFFVDGFAGTEIGSRRT